MLVFTFVFDKLGWPFHRFLTDEFRERWNMRRVLSGIEFLLVVLCLVASYSFTKELYYRQSWHWHDSLTQHVVLGFLFLISWYVLSAFSSIAKLPRNQRYLNVLFLYLRGFFYIFVAMVALKYILGLKAVSLPLIGVSAGFTMVATLFLRVLTILNLRIYRANGYNLRNVIIVGDSAAEYLIDTFIQQKDWGFKINSIITNDQRIENSFGRTIHVSDQINGLKEKLDTTVIDEVIYCKQHIEEIEIKRIASWCDEIGVIFRFQTSTSKVEPYHVELKTLNHNDSHKLVDIPSHGLAADFKTISDICFSIIALIVLSPFLLSIIIMIKLTSKGPVFFKQERVGLRGRKFNLYKFRTMVINAEQLLEKLRKENEMDGPTFKMKDDPRVTPIGRFLRKSGIDEFPQLYNVIRGEMSLIGPRPPLESEVKQYKRWQLRRLSVKPGITCTWQIMPQRNDIKFEKWMRMDLQYIDSWSLSKDFLLVFKTIMTIFLATGR